jgi:curli production assembly/transport component CsgG
MQNIQNFLVEFFILIVLLFFAGCAAYEPLKTTPAAIGVPTAVEKELTKLPPPKEQIVAAVYKFRDQTGQYKLTETGNSFSTAVTQGATSILIKALEDSGWFIPIEREGLSDLLNERKIIRSSRENFLGEDGKKLPDLPPLLYAGVILEGGIISYDTDVLTGGAGVKYLGATASGQYREDKVTIYLRAVSTQNGRILKTVYTTKTILSQMVDLGLFKFVDYQSLLEVETGYTYNEPVDLCVTEAIQKAVESLIIEGIQDGLWQVKNPKDLDSPVIKNFSNDQIQSNELDDLGNSIAEKHSKIGIDLNIGGQQYSGDYPNPLTKMFESFGLRFNFNNRWALGANYRSGRLGAESAFDNIFNSLGIGAYYKLIPQYDFTPYLTLGGEIIYKKNSGALYPDYSASNTTSSKLFYSLVSGIGVEYSFSKFISLNVELNNHYVFSDMLDGLKHGNLNDYFWGANVGFTVYLFNNLFKN